jgi:SulP family sulfate permease
MSGWRFMGLELARFRPRLLDALKGYNRQRFGADLGAGVTVGIVALPLAMAFAIASGVKPEQGIFTAIIGGFLVSLLGGSNVQIGGPAGAFIVIVYGILLRYGLTNLLIATALAGLLLLLMGLFRLGALVRYVPVTIVIGFTNGIAVLIAFSQIKDLLGLSIDKLPSDFFAQIHVLSTHLGSLNLYALALGALCVLMLFGWPRLFSSSSVLPPALLEGRTLRTAARVPGPIVALVSLSLLAFLMELPVETIGTRFGGIPQSLPTLELPAFSWQSAKELVFPTLTIALLGAIESLLCARIADNLIDKPRHDPNQELMALGVANMVVPFFGGIPVTGTIARTVTSIRAGAYSPIAGIVHSATLLVVVLVAAPLAMNVPLAVLAGIVLFAAWNMGEWHEFARLRHFSVPYRTVVLGTFFLTVVFDLTVAVQVGLVLACGFFIYRMGMLFRVELAPDSPQGVRVYRLYGALFFGAVSKVEAVSQSLPQGTRAVVLEMHQLVSMDNSGLDVLTQLHRALTRQGVRLVLCDLNEQPRAMLRRAGFDAELGAVNLTTHLGAALARATEPV